MFPKYSIIHLECDLFLPNMESVHYKLLLLSAKENKDLNKGSLIYSFQQKETQIQSWGLALESASWHQSGDAGI